jgi:hypothetical protein
MINSINNYRYAKRIIMAQKIVVIGVNHAGTSVIRTLLAQNRENRGAAFDRNDNISFLGCGIALAVSGAVKDPESLFYADVPALEGMGASVLMNHDVIKVDAKRSLSPSETWRPARYSQSPMTSWSMKRRPCPVSL